MVWSGLVATDGLDSSKVLSAIKTETGSPLSLSRIAWAVRSTGETFVARESCSRLSLTGACVMSAVAQNQQARVEVGRCIWPACHSLIASQCGALGKGDRERVRRRGHASSWAAGPGGCGGTALGLCSTVDCHMRAGDSDRVWVNSVLLQSAPPRQGPVLDRDRRTSWRRRLRE